MGEVYKARDTRLDRIVAIKILPPEWASDPAMKERFDREAQTIASLNHPHICVLHDVGTEDDVAFLVMEYLEGETLAERLTRGALPLEEAMAIAIAIADALDKAHRQGRDPSRPEAGERHAHRRAARSCSTSAWRSRARRCRPRRTSRCPA